MRNAFSPFHLNALHAHRIMCDGPAMSDPVNPPSTAGTVGESAPAPLVAEDLMPSAEVAALFGVSSATIWRWSEEGKLTPRMTLGGQRRYRRAEVEALIRSIGGERSA